MCPISKETLQKYLQGNCNDKEEEEVHRWLDQNDSDDYPQAHAEKKYEQKIRRNWQRLAMQVDGLQSLRGSRRLSRRYSFRWAAAAAALMLLLATAFLYGDRWKEGWQAEKKYQTGYGEIKRINLEDGTIVTLNAESMLEVNNDFGGKERRVRLEGEAYFQVKQLPGKPFTVRAGGVSVTALGTAFNVSAFANEPDLTVSLREGKVLVKTFDRRVAPERKDVVLLPGEEAVYSRNTASVKVESFETKERLSWQRQMIYFENAGLPQVLHKLERFYGVSFDTHLLKSRNWQLTGEYENQTLRDVLESLSFNYNLKYKIEGKKVILYE